MIKTVSPMHRRVFGSQRLRSMMNCLLSAAAICLAARAEAYETVSIKATNPFGSKNATLTAEVFKPSGDGPFPAVVLMHGCGGWQPTVLGALRAHALHFASQGYVVLNLDSFSSRGNSGGTVCESNARLAAALKYRTDDAFDALRYLQSLKFVNPERVFLMGQSNGGSVAILAAKMAARRGFRAVAAYYPWCGALGSSNVALTAPLIIFGGANDDWTPVRDCLKTKSTGAKLTVIKYPNAAHSFDVEVRPQRYLGKLIGFDRSATEDSRARILTFFDGQPADRQ